MTNSICCSMCCSTEDEPNINLHLFKNITLCDECYISSLRSGIKDAINQIEYLHEKFQETGTGNAVISRLRGLIYENRS